MREKLRSEMGLRFRGLAHGKRGSVLAGCLIGTAVGTLSVAALGLQDSGRLTVVRPAAAAQTRDFLPEAGCVGGQELGAELEIFPDAVHNARGAERIEYHAELTLKRGVGVGVSWQVDVLDDRGNIVVPKLDSGARKASAGDVVMSNALLTTLPDGYFMLRVRAAFSGKDESGVVETAQYLHVKEGKWRELSDAEWYRYSNVTLVFAEVSP